MPGRVLSTRELNRALLARQLLLGRASAPIPAALERVGGLQMQYAPSGYIGLWSRLASFRREALTGCLKRRSVVQATAMRATIHLVSRRDYGLFTAGVRASRREWWVRTNRRRIQGVDMEAAADELRAALADGPRRADDLLRALADAGFPKIAWQGAGMFVDLVRVPPSGTWERRRADLYALAEQEVGAVTATEDEGLAHLVRRYLRGFGPATVDDIAAWAGIPATLVRPVAEGLRLRSFRDESDRQLLDVARAPLPAPDTPAPVRFLPTWDATLLVHARRCGVLPEAYRPAVFAVTNPQSVPTFLVDGAIAGTWRYSEGRVDVEYFEPVPNRVRREVDDEAQCLAAFHRD